MKKQFLAVSLSAILLAGCAMTDEQKTMASALGGAVLGGVVGHQVNHKNGRYVGAVLGALAAGSIAHYMDKQEADLSQVLAASGISVTRVDAATIKLHIPNSITFPVNRANLNSSVFPYLNSIARVVNEYKETAIHVLGYADSDGAANYNLDLSQRRADAAAQYLIGQGVVAGRVVARGYGEDYPVASNATAAGKAENRRVEIYIRAIEKGNEGNAYAPIH